MSAATGRKTPLGCCVDGAALVLQSGGVAGKLQTKHWLKPWAAHGTKHSMSPHEPPKPPSDSPSESLCIPINKRRGFLRRKSASQQQEGEEHLLFKVGGVAGKLQTKHWLRPWAAYGTKHSMSPQKPPKPPSDSPSDFPPFSEKGF